MSDGADFPTLPQVLSGEKRWCFIIGDNRETIKQVPDNIVQCIVTSPPYFGLRDYKTGTWEGGDNPECDHLEPGTDRGEREELPNPPAGWAKRAQGKPYAGVCGKCGAMRVDKQIGLEQTPDQFCAALVELLRECKRVLHPTGTVYLNLGDSYFSGSQRATSCDTSDRGLEGYRENDCLCGSLCDACRAAYRLGKSHSDGPRVSKPSLLPFASTRDCTELTTDRFANSDSFFQAGRIANATPGLSQSEDRASEQHDVFSPTTPCESSPQHPGECLPMDTPFSCLVCGQTLKGDAPETADRSACTCGTETISQPSGRDKSDTESLGKACRHSTTESLSGQAFKPKDLMMMPARLAIALQNDGWYLRSFIPWIKRNPMPESVDDRPGSTIEFIMLLAKSPDYFYDSVAVRVPGAEPEREKKNESIGGKNGAAVRHGEQGVIAGTLPTRGRRNADWFFESWQGLYEEEPGEPLAMVVNIEGFKGSHFATFPTRLVQPIIQAGTSEKGACPKCRAPWVRIVEKDRQPTRPANDTKVEGTDSAEHGNRDPERHVTTTKTIGWQPGCECVILSCECGYAESQQGETNAPFNNRKTARVRAKGLCDGPEISGEEVAREREEAVPVLQAEISGPSQIEDVQPVLHGEEQLEKRSSEFVQEGQQDLEETKKGTGGVVHKRPEAVQLQGHQNFSERLQGDSSPRASDGGFQGLHSGASPSDGRAFGADADKSGGDSSQEQSEARQQNREPANSRMENAPVATASDVPALQERICPSCGKKAKVGSPDPVPCIAMDIFSGTATVGAVAVGLGRSYIGLELSQDYAQLGRQRMSKGVSKPSAAAAPKAVKANKGQASLFTD